MGKDKNKSLNETQPDDDMEEENGCESYDDQMKYVSKIAHPMASEKLSKKLYKCVKKGMKHKEYIRHGLKDVQSRIRKGERGLVVFAGDVTPVEVMCHLPAVCEDKNLPYVYTPSRRMLGAAMGVKRGTLMVLIREHEDYKKLFNKCKEEMEALPAPVL